MTTIPLNKLRHGDDYPGGSINARKTNSDEGIAELAATILDKGLIQALLIKTGPDRKPYVAEGNRRLKALRLLLKSDKIAKDWAVKVEEMAPDVDPLELSLTANIMALPMHEVDQYEAFAKLADAGKSEADIASAFGTSGLVVRRRLALGTLSPKLRDAWREGKFGPEVAQTFTISQDHALQEQVYASLAKGGMLFRHSIVRALTRSDAASAADLAFVGRDAYLAAGGRLVDDLFQEATHVFDEDILKRLERDKIDAVCAALVREGWAWASLRSELPHASWNWPKLDVQVIHTDEEAFRLDELAALADAKATTSDEVRARELARIEKAEIMQRAWFRSIRPADRSRAGCILRVAHDGALKIDHGIVRPGEMVAGVAGGEIADGAAATGHGGVEVEEHDGPTLSGALSQALSEQLTAAVATALMDDPDLALRVLVAAFRSYGSPARIRGEGWAGLGAALEHPAGSRAGTFSENFDMALRSSTVHLRAEIAQRVAMSLDLTDAAMAHAATAVGGRQALVDALDANDYLKAARRAFDAASFFDRAPVAVAIAAIEEMRGPKPTGKKGVVALAAATLAQEVGWLPPLLRSRHYVDPVVAEASPQAEAAPRGRRKAPAGAAPASH